MRGTIVQVSASNGGVPKYPVLSARLSPEGVEGDRQAHPQFHGGPRQAVLLISVEDLDTLAAQGFPVYPGALGENLTTRGIDFRTLRIGQRLRAGEAVVKLTKLRQPCHQLDPYGPGVQAAVFDAAVKAGDSSSPRWGVGGFYASVETPGMVKPDDRIEVLDPAV